MRPPNQASIIKFFVVIPSFLRMYMHPALTVRPVLVIHGGAGVMRKDAFPKHQQQNYLRGLLKALKEGYDILRQGGSSLDAVERAVVVLENNPLFNAG